MQAHESVQAHNRCASYQRCRYWHKMRQEATAQPSRAQRGATAAQVLCSRKGKSSGVACGFGRVLQTDRLQCCWPRLQQFVLHTHSNARPTTGQWAAPDPGLVPTWGARMIGSSSDGLSQLVNPALGIGSTVTSRSAGACRGGWAGVTTHAA